MKPRSNKPKHNWSNVSGERKMMLDMKRQKYFVYEMWQILEKTKDQDNKNLIGATFTNAAAKTGIDSALEYLDRMVKDGLEPEIGDELRRLLSRYTRYR
jgi:hypothetical protein